jgi:hypothetical protein
MEELKSKEKKLADEIEFLKQMKALPIKLPGRK